MNNTCTQKKTTLFERLFIERKSAYIDINDEKQYDVTYIYNPNNIIELNQDDVFTEKVDTKKVVFISNRYKQVANFLGTTLEKTNISNFNKAGNCVKVSYTCHESPHIGRYYAKGCTNLQSIKNQLRGAISGEYYYDVDLRSCNQSIICWLCRMLDINRSEYPFVYIYMKDKKPIVEELHKLNSSASYEECKQVFTTISFGSKSKYFNKDVTRKVIPSKGLLNYRKEMTKLSKLIIEHFPEFTEMAKHKLETEGNPYRGDVSNKALALLIQFIECQIVMYSLRCIKNDTYGYEEWYNHLSLQHDGFLIRKSLGKGKNMDIHALVKDINFDLQSEYNLDVQEAEFIIKPMEDDCLMAHIGYDASKPKEQLKVITPEIQIEITSKVKWFEVVNVLMDRLDGRYRREYDTCIIYEKVNDYYYAYTYDTIEPLMNKLFTEQEMGFLSKYIIEEIKRYVRTVENNKFPFIEINHHLIGFTNGVYDMMSDTLIPKDEVPINTQVRKMFDVDYEVKDAPLLDAYMRFQFDEEEEKFVYFAMGRCMTMLDDKFDFMPMLYGEGNSGKSLLANLVRHSMCPSAIGILSRSLEPTFGISNFVDKQLVCCDDMPSNISYVLERSMFLSMMSRGSLSCPRKNRTPINVQDWRIPTLINSNIFPNYGEESNEIVRRIAVINFGNSVPDNEVDTTLEYKIKESEYPTFLHRCRKMYLDYKKKYNDVSVQTFMPQFILEAGDELKESVNDSYQFGKHRLRYCEGGKLSKSELNRTYREHVLDRFALQKLPQDKKISISNILKVDNRFKFIREQICKSCKHKHIKGCCDMYSRTNRTLKEYLYNIEVIPLYEI